MHLIRARLRALSLALLAGALLAPARASHGNSVETVEYALLADRRVAVRIVLAHPPAKTPALFRVLHPEPRIVLDFPHTARALPERDLLADLGPLRSIHLVPRGEHLRLVLRLSRNVRHELEIEGRRLSLLLEAP